MHVTVHRRGMGWIRTGPVLTTPHCDARGGSRLSEHRLPTALVEFSSVPFLVVVIRLRSVCVVYHLDAVCASRCSVCAITRSTNIYKTALGPRSNCFAVYSKENLKTYFLPLPFCGSALVTRLHHELEARPMKVGSSSYHSTIRCLKLLGPLFEIGSGESGWNSWNSRS